MAHRATTVQAFNSHTVLETVRIELLDPHMAAVAWVICEAQWQAANIKVFISFPQFTIYSAWLTSQLPFSMTTKNQLLVRVSVGSECRGCAGERLGEWCLGGRPDCRNHARCTALFS